MNPTITMEYNPIWLLQRIYGNLWVSISLDDPIVPGQPISFSFQAITLAARKLDLGAVTASIYLVDDVGAPLFGMNSPLWTITLPKGEIASPTTYTSKDYSFIPPAPQMNAAYTINGNQSLALLLQGSGADGGPYWSSPASLNVTYEHVDDSWWEWTAPQNQTVQWKVENYVLDGNMHNRSVVIQDKLATNMACTLTLLEKNLTDTDPPNAEYAAAPVGVPQSNEAAVTWAALNLRKDWRWFIPGIYAPNGAPTSKIFAYSVRLDMKDPYNNGYPPYEFPPVFVTVQVSDQKWNASASALSAFNIWAGESALALALIWCAGPPVFCNAVPSAIATAALVVLGIAGKIADDPPEWDPLYREPVEVKVPEVPKALRESQRFADVAAAFQLIIRMLADVDALSSVTNGLSSARLRHDKDATKMHLTEHRRIVRELSTDAEMVGEATARAVPLLNPSNFVSIESLKAVVELKRERGVEAQRADVSEEPLPNNLQQLAAYAQHAPLTTAQLANPGRSLEVLAGWVRQLALHVEQDALEVLG